MSQSIRPVRKAVFPVAGLGTRFLPASKAVPKEMLTVVDAPVIQYAVDEARAAGIEHMIFVTGRNKHVIEDHFDVQPELQSTLEARGKTAMLDVLKKYQPEAGTTSFTRQQAPLGLGHAVWCARDIVGDEPFALLLPDMVMKARTPCLASMMEVYRRTGGNIVAVEECDPQAVSSYGIVAPGEGADTDAAEGFPIVDMVEKPAVADAPSNLFINGRYILQPEIFALLGNQEKGAGGEIQLTDSMLRLQKDQPFSGFTFRGDTFDCGSKEGFIAANVSFALDREDTGTIVREIIKKLMAS
ncbi:UTP--glucose-1-phosphate uridylyltransferase [Rhizobiaceae bacterium]|nr:UTP--glucose-1-phosphate uridylyltransferase [Rhizobiaceae bacterium]